MWRRFLVLMGIAAIAAWFVRRGRDSAEHTVGPDPSEELRRRLEEARRREGGAEVPSAEAVEPPDLDARRRDVHDRARAAVDEMQGSTD